MRISDWSSDVCSSYLDVPDVAVDGLPHGRYADGHADADRHVPDRRRGIRRRLRPAAAQFRRASRGSGRDHHLRARRCRTRRAAMEIDGGPRDRAGRSEEHTSELQSLMRISYAVFYLKTQTKKYRYNTLINNT